MLQREEQERVVRAMQEEVESMEKAREEHRAELEKVQQELLSKQRQKEHEDVSKVASKESVQNSVRVFVSVFHFREAHSENFAFRLFVSLGSRI